LTPIIKDRTLFFVGYDGQRSDAQDSTPVLTKSNIFALTGAKLPIIAALANDPGKQKATSGV